jgi:hypothetical protein
VLVVEPPDAEAADLAGLIAIDPNEPGRGLSRLR